MAAAKRALVAAAVAWYLSLQLVLCRTVPASEPFRVELIRRHSENSAAAIMRSQVREAAIQHYIVQVQQQQLAKFDSQDQMYSPFQSSSVSASASTGYTSPLSMGNGEYLLKISIGTPALEFNGIMDTGSDLIWTQCKPCLACFPQKTAIFDPTKSSSYKQLGCSTAACEKLSSHACSKDNSCIYGYVYADGSNTTGYLSTETFKLSGSALPGVLFGCGLRNYGEAFVQGTGVIGFGRGSFSLPAQFSKITGNPRGDFAFSYCLVSDNSRSSPLWLGDRARTALPRGANLSATPLFVNEKIQTFYYVKITAIDVAGSAVSVPNGAFDIRSDGSGGLVFDSGTALTFLEQRTHGSLIGALRSAIKLKASSAYSDMGLDLCYPKKDAIPQFRTFPTVTVTFNGGARMVWGPSNYMFLSDDGFLCVGLAAVSQTVGTSIIGNIAQNNFFVLHDTADNKLSFAPANCSSI